MIDYYSPKIQTIINFALFSTIGNLSKSRIAAGIKGIIVYLVVLLSVCFQCYAQTPAYTINNYNTDNGLPQSSVKSIVFDKAGYCWMATEMGLVQFDGRNFNVYGMSEIPGITSDRIKLLATDFSGVLYALTGSNERVLIDATKSSEPPFPKLIVNKHKYIPTLGFVTEKKHIDSLYDAIFANNQHPHAFEGRSDSNGDVYIVMDRSVYYVTRPKAMEIFNSPLASANWGKTIVDGKYYVHLYSGNKIKVWKNGISQPGMNNISGPIVKDKSYLSGKSQVLWCKEGTYVYTGKTLFRLYIEKGKMFSEKILDDLIIPDLACLYYAKDHGKYYFGSYTGGLYIAEPSTFKYPTVPKQVTSEIFYSQSITKDGRIFSRDILFSQSSDPQYLPINSKEAGVAYVTAQNQLYYESAFILFRYDLNTNVSKAILPVKWKLRSIMPDGPSDLILCTNESIGILSNDILKNEQRFPDTTKVTSVLRLSKNNFLLASNKGVKWYEMSQNRFYKSILDSMQIRTVKQDSGKLWIASYGKGFFLYENNKLHSLPLGPKESLRTIHAFIDDGSGHFWLPTNNGLFKVRKTDLLAYAHGEIPEVYFYMLTKQNGLRTNEFNGGCDHPYVRMKDGMLSLSSINGLAWFYPDKTRLNYPDKKIYIDKIVAGDLPILASGKSIELPPDFDNFSISVSSPYFGNSENFHLEYKITGISDNWKLLPGDGKVSISRSPSGNYKLLVRRLSPVKDEILELSFAVKPWFYNTWWFYLLLILCFVFVAYLIFKQRLKSVIERANQLELLVSGRTQELSLAIEQIAQSESALLKSTKVKDRVITMVLHDLRSPIRFLGTISDYLANNHKSLNEVQLEERLTELQIGTKALRGFTDQFFTWAVSQHEDFKVNNTLFKIQVLFDELAALYCDIAKSKANLLTIEASNLDCYTDYQMLALILRNLIDNANKNTSNGQIKLSAIASENSVSIYIQDTGKGLTPEQVNTFIDESKEMRNEGTGSILILNMIQKIGGKLEISTTVDKGSTFGVTLNHPSRPDDVGQG